MATSYGAPESKLDSYPQIGSSIKYEPEPKPKQGAKGVWIRLAIGYESDFDTVVNGLKQLMAQ